MEEVQRGHNYLQRCCHAMLKLGIHLLPNHHLAMHYPEIFRLFGPVYAWWLYAHERFNGIQENVNHNGKGEGELELTLLRNWVLKHRLYELVRCVLQIHHRSLVYCTEEVADIFSATIRIKGTSPHQSGPRREVSSDRYPSLPR